MTSPFEAAEWNEEYDLGAVWKPEPHQSHGSIVYWKSSQGIDVVKGVSGHGYINGVNIDDALPLLMSPDEINAQSDPCASCGGCGESRPWEKPENNPDCEKCKGEGRITPRAVAIAALERAGFKTWKQRETWERSFIEIPTRTGVYQTITFMYSGRVSIDGYTDDPTLAQYAVDCFKVLHEWAGKVKWNDD